MSTTAWNLRPMQPFGQVVQATPGSRLETVPAQQLHDWALASRVVVLRGFALFEGQDLPQFCTRLGELLEWDFGTVNELRVHDDPKNYLFTTHAVPLHWDGAFVGKVPSYLFFQCLAAPPPGSGGETVFTDTTRVLELATPAQREAWAKVRITYTTEKIVHYGGSFTASLLHSHPRTSQPTMRFAEPVHDLNPVSLQIDGVPAQQQAAFLQDLTERLYQPTVCLAHEWQAGDLVLADNHALLHGRRAFLHPGQRHIQRVNIL